MIPMTSQGYIGIECLSSNNKIIKIFKNLTSNKDLAIANAERNFVASMDGECLSPISILIKEIEKNNLLIKAKVSCLDGSTVFTLKRLRIIQILMIRYLSCHNTLSKIMLKKLFEDDYY